LETLNNELLLNSAVRNKWAKERNDDSIIDINASKMYFFERVGLNLPKLAPKVIHVAGTKGKGSCCTFVESLLLKHGYTTGVFTSPHLVTLRERIRLNGNSICEDKFTKYFWIVWNALESGKASETDLPIWFRFLTLLALKVFEGENVDCIILEVGIGGRVDSTNCFSNPVATAVTKLDYDHMKLLGNTLREIGFEKAGIFKKGVPAVTIPQEDEGITILKERAIELESSQLYMARPLEHYLSCSNIKSIQLGIKGIHQHINASIALALVDIFLQRKNNSSSRINSTEHPNVDQASGLPYYPLFHLTDKLQAGLTDCFLAGRSHIFEHNGITFYMDGAHTPISIVACTEWFCSTYRDNITTTTSQTPKNNQTILLFNCAKSRDPKTLLSKIYTHSKKNGISFDSVLFTSPKIDQNSRKDDSNVSVSKPDDNTQWQQKMKKEWPNESTSKLHIMSTINAAMDMLEELSKTSKVHVFVTGTFYLVGGVLEIAQFEV